MLTYRPVVPTTDSDLLHAWVTEERASFWGMTDKTRDEVEEIYTYIDEQEHLAAYLVRDGDEPLGLVQTYDPFVDEIGDFYDRLPGDLGIHFFMNGEQAHRTADVVTYMRGQMFADPTVERLVFEPDARNTRAVGLMLAIGAELGPRVELPTKPAQFAFLARAVDV